LIRSLGADPRDYPQMSARDYGYLGYLIRERKRRAVAKYRAEHGLPAEPEPAQRSDDDERLAG
jgi:hypothetical protein